MIFSTKVLIIAVCAAICALSLLPRAEKTRERRNQTTPVLSRESQQGRWLLV
jgi:hypothetical protein